MIKLNEDWIIAEGSIKHSKCYNTSFYENGHVWSIGYFLYKTTTLNHKVSCSTCHFEVPDEVSNKVKFIYANRQPH